jgi:hypothetical protein
VVNTSIDGEAGRRALIPGHLLNAKHWFDKYEDMKTKKNKLKKMKKNDIRKKKNAKNEKKKTQKSRY